jgi:hypothetical protein
MKLYFSFLLLFLACVSCDDASTIKRSTATDMGNIGLVDQMMTPLDQQVKDQQIIADQMIDAQIDTDQALIIDQMLQISPIDGFCQACDDQTPCQAQGAMCLTNTSTGERFCGMDCRQGEACPRGTSCIDLGNGSSQCAPIQGSCIGYPPSDLAQPCVSDETCQNQATLCYQGLCSQNCQTDADCGSIAPICESGYCRPSWTIGVNGCGLADQCDGRQENQNPCANDQNQGFCADEILNLKGVKSFCTQNCTQDSDCGLDATCIAVSQLSGLKDSTQSNKICLPKPCDCLVQAQDQVDLALSNIEHNRCTAVLSKDKLDAFPENLKADAFRLNFYDVIHFEPFRALDFGAKVSASVGKSAKTSQKLYEIIEQQADLINAKIKDVAMPITEDQNIIDEIRTLYEMAGKANRFNASTTTEKINTLPMNLRSALSKVLHAQRLVLEAKQEMFNRSGIDFVAQADLFERIVGSMIEGRVGVNFNQPTEVQLLSRTLDFSLLFGSIRNLVSTIEMIDWQSFEGQLGVALNLDTPFGRIVIQDASDQTLVAYGAYLFFLDLGGNDRYEGQLAATVDYASSVSIAIDLAGDDRWGYAEMDRMPEVKHLPPADEMGRNVVSNSSKSDIARQGTGIFGAGLLFDFKGNDQYYSLKISQGVGIAGVGLLYDQNGDDLFLCEQGCQGAGAFGIGILVDQNGTDEYRLAQSGQGYGGIRGSGVLVDINGNDRYMAILGDPIFGGQILYLNAQNRNGSNTSFAQGAAFGRRADQDGTYASGGIGVFRDEAGDDTYIVDIFGQGTGYWFGTGIFSDLSGNDTYHGRWYVQGSSAHFAVSLFYEGAGNDVYNPGLPTAADPNVIAPTMMATATGQGHDFSVGILAEYQGDDLYYAPGLGLGGGNDQGIGILLEAGGVDQYFTSDGSTYGGSNSGERGAFFEDALCLGVFVDADGLDSYPNFTDPNALIGNDRAWTLAQRREMRRIGMNGSGIDVSGGIIQLPSLNLP